jgi:hypothetical protein
MRISTWLVLVRRTQAAALVHAPMTAKQIEDIAKLRTVEAEVVILLDSACQRVQNATRGLAARVADPGINANERLYRSK